MQVCNKGAGESMQPMLAQASRLMLRGNVPSIAGLEPWGREKRVATQATEIAAVEPNLQM